MERNKREETKVLIFDVVELLNHVSLHCNVTKDYC